MNLFSTVSNNFDKLLINKIDHFAKNRLVLVFLYGCRSSCSAADGISSCSISAAVADGIMRAFNMPDADFERFLTKFSMLVVFANLIFMKFLVKCSI